VIVLFEHSTHDMTLFWNVTNALQRVYENNVVFEQALLDAHLVESLVNVLVRIVQIVPEYVCACAFRLRTPRLTVRRTL
jgi:hypothetical protein